MEQREQTEQPWDFDSAVTLMDDTLREQLHNRLAPCEDVEFLTAYCEAHLDVFGEDFVWV